MYWILFHALFSFSIHQNSSILETNIPLSSHPATSGSLQPIEISRSSMTNSTNTFNSESSQSSNHRVQILSSSGLLKTDETYQQQLHSLATQSNSLSEGHDYKAKCRSIQAQIKEMVFINSAVQGRISDFREKIVIAKNERKFLLNKLLSYERTSGTGNEITSTKILHNALSKKTPSKKSDQIKIKIEPGT